MLLYRCRRCFVWPSRAARDAPPPAASNNAKGGVLRYVRHSELLHQQGHPPRGRLQPTAEEITSLAPIGKIS